MRKMTYISPTSLKQYYDDRDKFYMIYLSDAKLGRDLQTPPMAVGSAFDAYVKSHLHEKLIGTKDPKFEFRTIFEAQVEKQNRDEALKAGLEVFTAYQRHGALADILVDLEGCIGAPRFETSIEGYVDAVSVKIGAVPFLGKPDIFFITKNGARVIFDWKVNGYYSARPVSPKPGYIRCLPSRDPHKDAFVGQYKGLKVNLNRFQKLEVIKKDWSNQTSIYAWLLGEDVGSDFIVAIDQICVADQDIGRSYRIAQHRSFVGVDYQKGLFEKAHKMWYGIIAEHIFDELTKEESDGRCKALDAQVAVMSDDDFMSLCRTDA